MTEPLQMIRAEINVRDFQRWMGMRRLQDPDHAMHCFLVESFGSELAPKPFRAIFPRGGSHGCLYGYGTADAETLREAAGLYADPLQSRIIPPHGIDSKPMPAEWTAGKRLGFEVRVRPVVRRTDKAECRPGREWDAFQLEAIQHPKGEMPRSREEVYTDWLRRQFQIRGGAALESATLVSFQRTRAVRRLRGGYSEGPDALMRGVLEITDGTAFGKLLAGGVGRHRAYGYGMLLLRPAGRQPAS
ncbi:MAG: type I-E CRISPR-associated protein Cas6/Cse3/CasE [Chloroflexota bacterium]|nr:type I-E CRISPR-associated protein Cas6/Cse3/CasE [Chloroflexota bacterium]MDE2959657.1 type I-E CRISPR-associated protein Cas6/Cse3/CasE [Chloroflexota bacterium]